MKSLALFGAVRVKRINNNSAGVFSALTLWLLFCLLTCLSPARADEYAAQRAAMVSDIEQHVKETSVYLGKDQLDPAVIEALQTVPRHDFVPWTYRDNAYENRPQPIGYGQTISQPYIVAIMSDLLQLKPGDKVFELGTGSGYQAAILGAMGCRVYSMEIVDKLAQRSSTLLQRLYPDDEIQTRSGDAYFGWEQHAPFDAIIVTAAGDHIPPPLIKQLKPGGRMIIPVGNRFFAQQLLLIEKSADGRITSRDVMPVRFVPITGDH